MVVVWFWKLLICALNYTFVAYDQDSFLLMEHIESEITWGHKDVRFILILIFTHKSHTFYRVECLIGIAQWPSASCLTLNRSKSWFITILLTMILGGRPTDVPITLHIVNDYSFEWPSNDQTETTESYFYEHYFLQIRNSPKLLQFPGDSRVRLVT